LKLVESFQLYNTDSFGIFWNILKALDQNYCKLLLLVSMRITVSILFCVKVRTFCCIWTVQTV